MEQTPQQWAQELLRTPNKLLIIDTETTGLDNNSEVVSVAIVNGRGELLLDSLLQQEGNIPKEATAIHGITNESTFCAPSFAAIYPALHAIIHQYTQMRYVGYNVSFDVQKLNRECERLRLPLLFDGSSYDRQECVMERFAELYGDYNSYHHSYRWQKLATACQHFAIDTGPLGREHSAAGDALRAYAVLKAMAVAKVDQHDET